MISYYQHETGKIRLMSRYLAPLYLLLVQGRKVRSGTFLTEPREGHHHSLKNEILCTLDQQTFAHRGDHGPSDPVHSNVETRDVTDSVSSVNYSSDDLLSYEGWSNLGFTSKRDFKTGVQHPWHPKVRVQVWWARGWRKDLDSSRGERSRTDTPLLVRGPWVSRSSTLSLKYWTTKGVRGREGESWTWGDVPWKIRRQYRVSRQVDEVRREVGRRREGRTT